MLSALLAVQPDAIVVLQIDSRYPSTALPNTTTVFSVKPTLIDRLFAEFRLRTMTRQDDIVLCFGNLPPLFNLTCSVNVFIQNRYLIDSCSLKGFSWKSQLRLRVERFWIKRRVLTNVQILVQTPTMARLVEERLNRSATIAPFVASNDVQHSPQEEDTVEFLYVASGESHKNHRTLVKAWVLLAYEGYFPKLDLTLDPPASQDLLLWIKRQVACHHLEICNRGLLSKENLAHLYKHAKALIYPSRLESFGLPLIEAQEFGLPILAPELDYVRDVCVPTQTFDPESPMSIARAVRRFLGEGSSPVSPTSAAQFLNVVMGGKGS